MKTFGQHSKELKEETLVENKVRYQTFFGKDRMGVTATAFAEYTKYVAKKFKIKIVKTPNPKGPNHLTFEAPEKDMKKFQQHLKKNLVKNAVNYIQKKNAGEPYNESLEESPLNTQSIQGLKIMADRMVRKLSGEGLQRRVQMMTQIGKILGISVKILPNGKIELK